MKKLFLLSFVLILFSCKKESADERSFYMGFSPWLYDNTLDAQNWVYNKVNNYGDIISEHLEEGIPWPEAYNNEPFSANYVEEIQSRLQLKNPNQKVLLQISPLNVGRNGMALYRGSDINMSLPSKWSHLALNSDSIKTAYLNYAKRMIEYFSPDYMILGVESNLLIRNNIAIWPQYVDLHKYIYTELKKVYPNLQLSVSLFCVPFFPQWSSEDNLEKQMAGLNDLNPYLDFVSFSVHPFMSGLLAEQFPSDYFKNLFSITSKPVAISESSYPAQVWQTLSAPILTFNGSEAKQANFLKQMLIELEMSNAKFIIWFSVRDYDALWNNLLNKDPLALVWRDTGLFDEYGNQRSAFGVWEEYYIK